MKIVLKNPHSISNRSVRWAKMLSDMLMRCEMSGLKSMPSVYSISYKKKRRDLSNDIELRMLFLAVFRNKRRKKFFLLYVFAKLE